ncbi:hypothetical protein B0H14DRAFT_2626906 [Mycena olivaceomarginata]|nr:hypothetical protein B0H14DRAFT_2626906 [Mycena olivaceomarginata]
MKSPRERTLPVLDWSPKDVLPSPESAAQLSCSCFSQLKRLALEHIPGVSEDLKKGLGECPEVNQIRAKKEETDSWKLFAFWDPKTLMRAQIVVKTYVAVLTAFWTILI